MEGAHDLHKLFEMLENFERTFGIIGVVFAIAIIIGITFLYRYLVKLIEITAEEKSQKTLLVMNAKLDKELTKFQSKHQKQVDAIHETFQSLQRVNLAFDLIMNGDKFNQVTPRQEVELIITNRNQFKYTYHQNIILFPKELNSKIDSLIPKIDSFIETYNSGLLSEPPQNEDQSSEKENVLILAGVWSEDEFQILDELKLLLADIEKEFKKVYGSND
jgi:hypothetical protein